MLEQEQNIKKSTEWALVADQDKDWREIHACLLKKMGFEIIEASTSDAALAVLMSHEFAFAVIGGFQLEGLNAISMQERTGVDIVYECKDMNIPVIMCATISETNQNHEREFFQKCSARYWPQYTGYTVFLDKENFDEGRYFTELVGKMTGRTSFQNFEFATLTLQ